MKNKLIRVVSPASLAFAAILDLAGVLLLYVTCVKITERRDFYAVSLIIITAVTLPAALFTTVELFKNGVRFYSDRLEFTALDSNNIYHYAEINSVSAYKDTKLSFKKNLVERYSIILLKLTDGSTATVELGLTTRKKLNKITAEINKRIKKTD